MGLLLLEKECTNKNKVGSLKEARDLELESLATLFLLDMHTYTRHITDKHTEIQMCL